MGYALAEAACDQGANVTLISGPVNLKNHPESKLINVNTAEEMLQEIENNRKRMTFQQSLHARFLRDLAVREKKMRIKLRKQAEMKRERAKLLLVLRQQEQQQQQQQLVLRQHSNFSKEKNIIGIKDEQDKSCYTNINNKVVQNLNHGYINNLDFLQDD